MFKLELNFEKYFEILDLHEFIILCKYRTTNQRLPIETGRWNNVDRNDRKCHLCNLDSIGDEFHYLLVCPFFNDSRKLYLEKYYLARVNTLKFRKLMSKLNTKTELKRLCKFLKCITKHVGPPGCRV